MPSTASNILLSPFRLLTWSLRQFASTLLFLFSPFFIVLYYASYVLAPIYDPFSILSRFEPVYIFCGTAAVIGISVGCLVGFTNYLLFSAMSLTPTNPVTIPPLSPSSASPQGIKQLRDERRKRRSELENQNKIQKRQQKVEPARTPPLRKPKSIPTILEEDDEEEYYGTTTPAESLGGRETIGFTPLIRKQGNHSDTDQEFGF